VTQVIAVRSWAEFRASGLGRWLSGRPGTSGAALVALGIAWLVGGGGAGTQWSRAVWILVGLGVLAVLCGVFRFLIYITRRMEGEAEAEKAARRLARPRWRCPWQWAAAGAGAVAVVNLAWLGLSEIAPQLWSEPPGLVNEIPDRRASTLWVAALLFIVCAPLLEELLYRGGVQGWLGRRAPAWAALLAATALFTWAHSFGASSYNEIQLASVLSTGLIYARLYQVTGSVVPGMVAHATWNGLSLVSMATDGLLVAISLPLALLTVAGGLAWRLAPPLVGIGTRPAR
jgi:membrane protease YdiL (CAAX protease family)